MLFIYIFICFSIVFLVKLNDADIVSCLVDVLQVEVEDSRSES